MTQETDELRESLEFTERELRDAKAEIARLRGAFEKYLKVTRPLLDDTKAWAEANAALKPDTGEKP